ncbi:MAG: hypothetical protein HY900_34685 [Deltaproteobacteria bacterium]|nr:hypothetical protein [Deltaproteobacteria bacterium]
MHTQHSPTRNLLDDAKTAGLACAVETLSDSVGYASENPPDERKLER